MSSASAKRHMAKIARLPCAACNAIGVHVHHIREERLKDDFLTTPLCPECHQGAFSIHMSKKQFESVYGSELQLLAKTIELLFK